MSVKLEQINPPGSILRELRNQLERIPSRFSECLQANPGRQLARNQGGRYTAWDFPEAPFHDLKVKMK
jgi:hypothetical protein